MFKKLLNIFKKEEVVEEKVVEKEEVVDILLDGEEEVETSELEEVVELITDPPELEALLVTEEDARDFDVDTKLKFEIYMGDDEDNVKLINEDLDFNDVSEAKAYAQYFALKNYPEQALVIFIHEEVEEKDGSKTLNRHY